MANILGIDVGDAKVGLAIGDSVSKFAFVRPALLVKDWSAVWTPLLEIISTDRVTTIVVGWPINTDGSTGPQTERVADFIDQLSKQTSITIIRRDERFSSQAVRAEQRGQKLARGAEDSLAAQLLVESYLQETA
jgi:putative Holliday junction resolvase